MTENPTHPVREFNDSYDKYDVSIRLDGRDADLFGLSILFSPGVSDRFIVTTQIIGEPHPPGHRVVDASKRTTILRGTTANSLIVAMDPQTAAAVCFQILRSLNGYAALLSPGFRGVWGTSAEMIGKYRQYGNRYMVFPGRPEDNDITMLGRHSGHFEVMESRLNFIETSLIAQRALQVIADRPAWTSYYRALEDIADDLGSTISKLHTHGLMTVEQNNAFRSAANNSMQEHEAPRHGLEKVNKTLDPNSLMNLVEGRELIREAVNAWLDLKCGNTVAREMVEHMGELRFGLSK